MCVGMNCDGSPLQAAVQEQSNVINITDAGLHFSMYCEADACESAPPPSIVIKLGEAWYCLRHAGYNIAGPPSLGAVPPAVA
jgi:hypothetical protein